MNNTSLGCITLVRISVMQDVSSDRVVDVFFLSLMNI